MNNRPSYCTSGPWNKRGPFMRDVPKQLCLCLHKVFQKVDRFEVGPLWPVSSQRQCVLVSGLWVFRFWVLQSYVSGNRKL